MTMRGQHVERLLRQREENLHGAVVLCDGGEQQQAVVIV